MKITCEHCGALIDTDKDKKCTNCGAPFRANKDYKNVRDYHDKNSNLDIREREADIQTKELQNKILEKTLNANKRISFMQIIITLIFFVIFIYAAIFIIKRINL